MKCLQLIFVALPAVLLPKCNSFENTICTEAVASHEAAERLVGTWRLCDAEHKPVGNLRVSAPNSKGEMPLAAISAPQKLDDGFRVRATTIGKTTFLDIASDSHSQWGHFILLVENDHRRNELRLLAFDVSKLAENLRNGDAQSLRYKLRPAFLGIKTPAIELPLSWADNGLVVTASTTELRDFLANADTESWFKPFAVLQRETDAEQSDAPESASRGDSTKQDQPRRPRDR